MPGFDEELHGDLCFGSFCPHYTVLNKLPAASALALYRPSPTAVETWCQNGDKCTVASACSAPTQFF